MTNNEKNEEEKILSNFYKFLLEVISFQKFIIKQQENIPRYLLSDFEEYKEKIEEAKEVIKFAIDSIDNNK